MHAVSIIYADKINSTNIFSINVFSQIVNNTC
jgi:hypothetical protein